MAAVVLILLHLCIPAFVKYRYRGLSVDELKKLRKIKGDELKLESDCCICQLSIEADNEAQLLPGCNHEFHSNCISTWLSRRPTCPLCRSNVRDVLEDRDECPC